MKLFLIDISWLFLFSKFGYPVSVENTKKIFLKPPDSPVEYGIYQQKFFCQNEFIFYNTLIEEK